MTRKEQRERQKQVLKAVAAGRDTTEVAKEFNLSLAMVNLIVRRAGYVRKYVKGD